MKPVDPLMGVEGTPQSATGQTSLFTGYNVPELIGKHTGGFPNREMRKLIKKQNILKDLRQNNTEAIFINAYPGYHKFFSDKHIDLTDNGDLIFSDEFPDIFRRKISVTTCLMLSSGQYPFYEEHLRKGQSIYQHYTNKPLIKRGLDLPQITPADAGRIVADAAPAQGLVLFEYFQTDLYGHRHSFEAQVEMLKNLDQLIGAVIDNCNSAEDTLIITSDHGNIEDSRHRNHTLNPVPFFVYGRNREKIAERAEKISDLYHIVMDYFNNQIVNLV